MARVASPTSSAATPRAGAAVGGHLACVHCSDRPEASSFEGRLAHAGAERPKECCSVIKTKRPEALNVPEELQAPCRCHRRRTPVMGRVSGKQEIGHGFTIESGVPCSVFAWPCRRYVLGVRSGWRRPFGAAFQSFHQTTPAITASTPQPTEMTKDIATSRKHTRFANITADF